MESCGFKVNCGYSSAVVGDWEELKNIPILPLSHPGSFALICIKNYFIYPLTDFKYF